jgi:hypothetical protein
LDAQGGDNKGSKETCGDRQGMAALNRNSSFGCHDGMGDSTHPLWRRQPTLAS